MASLLVAVREVAAKQPDLFTPPKMPPGMASWASTLDKLDALSQKAKNMRAYAHRMGLGRPRGGVVLRLLGEEASDAGKGADQGSDDLAARLRKAQDSESLMAALVAASPMRMHVVRMEEAQDSASRDASIIQKRRDIERDSLMLSDHKGRGRLLLGSQEKLEGVLDRLVAALAAQLAAEAPWLFAASLPDTSGDPVPHPRVRERLEAFASQILTQVNRTSSGGQCFDEVLGLVQQSPAGAGLLLQPNSRDSEPLEVRTFYVSGAEVEEREGMRPFGVVGVDVQASLRFLLLTEELREVGHILAQFQQRLEADVLPRMPAVEGGLEVRDFVSMAKPVVEISATVPSVFETTKRE